MTKEELISDLDELLTAVEIIDGQDYPPDEDDVQYLVEKVDAIRKRLNDSM